MVLRGPTYKLNPSKMWRKVACVVYYFSDVRIVTPHPHPAMPGVYSVGCIFSGLFTGKSLMGNSTCVGQHPAKYTVCRGEPVVGVGYGGVEECVRRIKKCCFWVPEAGIQSLFSQ